MTNIKRSPVLVLNQVVRGGYPKETESEAIVSRVISALVEAVADQSEKIIPGKSKAENSVNFVDEDGDGLQEFRQQHRFDKFAESLY